jgi:hypothetical protein
MDSHCNIPYFISGMIEPSQLYISAPSDQNLGFWKALGAHTSNKNGSKNDFVGKLFFCRKWLEYIS